MAQRIIDLDVVVPERIGVRIDGEVYDLPGDIPVPQYLRIARLTDELADPDQPAEEGALERLYDEVLDLFRVHQEIDQLPIGPARLGALVVQLYTQAAEEDAPARPPRSQAGTRSTSKTKPKRSRSSK